MMLCYVNKIVKMHDKTVILVFMLEHELIIRFFLKQIFQLKGFLT